MKVTREVIRKYFGDDAKIERKLLGGYRVTTWTGGDLDIDSDGETRIHAGGDDVYEAMVLMLSEGGGSVTVWGPSEHITAAMSHGVANDIVVIPEVRQGGGCLRFFVVMLVFFITLGVLGPRFPHGKPEWIAIFIALLVSRWVWAAMKKAQKRAERRAGQVYRYQFARVHGGPRDAARRDAERKGWL